MKNGEMQLRMERSGASGRTHGQAAAAAEKEQPDSGRAVRFWGENEWWWVVTAGGRREAVMVVGGREGGAALGSSNDRGTGQTHGHKLRSGRLERSRK